MSSRLLSQLGSIVLAVTLGCVVQAAPAAAGRTDPAAPSPGRVGGETLAAGQGSPMGADQTGALEELRGLARDWPATVILVATLLAANLLLSLAGVLMLSRLGRSLRSLLERSRAGREPESPRPPAEPRQTDPGPEEAVGRKVRAPARPEPRPDAAAPRQEGRREPDPFSRLPHGDVARELQGFRDQVPDISRRAGDPELSRRFSTCFGAPLDARIRRFREAASRGAAHLEQHWVEQDLVTALNQLAQFMSEAIGKRVAGHQGYRDFEQLLQGWLYDRLAPQCRAAGWFEVEPILPYTTVFDPKVHNSVGSTTLEGVDRPLVVAIKAIGRRDPGSRRVISKAEVVVGN